MLQDDFFFVKYIKK